MHLPRAVHAFFDMLASFGPVLVVIGLTLPFLMPRRGAAVGMMMIGWGAAVFGRAIGTWAICYGAAWVVIGIATHAMRRRAAKPRESTCRPAALGA